jgi:ubiquitin carboxyl-terminal hydrolase 25
MAESLETEPVPADQRARQEEVPVGLKNVGNTCYFNSFMQAFFFLPNL